MLVGAAAAFVAMDMPWTWLRDTKSSQSTRGLVMKNIALVFAAFAGIAAVAGVATSPVQAQARDRGARCVVSTEGNLTYRGPCRFYPESAGSFTVTPLRGTFPGETTGISVSIGERGVAEVYGLTPAGINSRWGTAVRSRRDRACWNGPDFSVCAY
jgi:hypothetical protein